MAAAGHEVDELPSTELQRLFGDSTLRAVKCGFRVLDTIDTQWRRAPSRQSLALYRFAVCGAAVTGRRPPNAYHHLMASAFSSPAVNEMPWLIRADFTDDTAWADMTRRVLVDPMFPDEDTQVGFVLVEDADYDGLTPAGLMALEPHRLGIYFIFDHDSVAHPDHPVLAVDVNAQPGTWFRLVPSAVQSFAVNMMLSNMDFDDFADNADPDGIFRRFDSSPGPAPTRQVETGVSAGPGEPPKSKAVTEETPGTVEDFIREAAADDPRSFIGQLIRQRRWDRASWRLMEAGMRAACHRYDNSSEVPRRLTAAFHSVMIRVPNLVAAPGFVGSEPELLGARLERIRVLSTWFFDGWSMQRPEGPLPDDETDLDAS